VHTQIQRQVRASGAAVVDGPRCRRPLRAPRRGAAPSTLGAATAPRQRPVGKRATELGAVSPERASTNDAFYCQQGPRTMHTHDCRISRRSSAYRY